MKNDQLVWTEQNPDRRWDHRSFSNLYGYDLLTGEKRQISSKKRFFSPDLNSKGSEIACLEYVPEGTNNLLLLDAFSGQEILRILPPDDEVFHQPFWDADGDIWLLSAGREGKCLR